MKLFEKIKFIRKINGISIDTLSTLSNTTRTFIKNVESGKAFPDYNFLSFFSLYFKIPYDYLVNDEYSFEGDKDKLILVKNNLASNTLYRKVIKTNNSLGLHQTSLEHYYNFNDGKLPLDYKERFELDKKRILNKIKEKNYTDCIFLTDDTLSFFFTNKENLAFGLFFNFSEQFVCPMENFISFEYSKNKFDVVDKGIMYYYDSKIKYYDDFSNIFEYNFIISLNPIYEGKNFLNIEENKKEEILELRKRLVEKNLIRIKEILENSKLYATYNKH